MSKKLHLTLACGDYEITRPLQDGSVQPDGMELTVRTEFNAEVRHARMVRNGEFDVAELSMSNYLVARFCQLPFVAIPVFLHRRFCHGFIFINATKGIEKAQDLIGKKVAMRHFQTTSNLWVRGILHHQYEVPYQRVHWFKQGEETVEAEPPRELRIELIPPGENIEKMLVEGELDAVIDPEIIQPVLDKDRRVKRLFENYKEIEIAYYQTTGIFPIMHTTAIRQEIVERHPWVPRNLMQAFERAKEIAMRKMENPRTVPLAWFQHALEEQKEIFASDPWAYGLGKANQKNLATLIQYSCEQGLIGKSMPVDELFVETTRS
jgi:4,5-dihydroxyphthalate decarboxylase